MTQEWFLALLESVLPYVRFAEAKGEPNAAYYAELIDGLLYRKEQKA